ncbi:MAG: phosphatase PAP2 family protein [Clostridia bacterium]|nr:phosphatase PAP2 family protein [Clostridia bacterium]
MSFFKRVKTIILSLPKYFWVLAVLTAASQFATYYLPRVLHAQTLTVLSSKIDDRIPFVPGFVYIYIGAFLYWVFMYGYVYAMNKPIAMRLFTADALCKLVCAVCFCVYPCTMAQPGTDEIRGFGAWLLRIVYAADEPTQLLPSMHCYISVLLALPLFSKRASRSPWGFKLFAAVFSLLICLSTLFVKQHVLVDVYTGVALAIASWLISLIIWKLIDACAARKAVV